MDLKDEREDIINYVGFSTDIKIIMIIIVMMMMIIIIMKERT